MRKLAARGVVCRPRLRNHCRQVRPRASVGDGTAALATTGLALAAASAIAFSAKAIFVKLAFAASSVDAVTLLTLRMLYAAPFYVVLLAWAGRAGPRPWTPRRLASVVGLGFVGYYLASLLDFLGLMYISAALERLVLFLHPTIVVLLSALILRRPITRREAGALVLSYVGITVVMWQDLGPRPQDEGLWIGCGLVFASAIVYSIYLLGASRLIAELGAIRFTAAVMLVSSACAVLHFGVSRPISALRQPSEVQLLAVAMAVISTVLPTALLAAAITRIGSERTALIGSIGPISTIALGYVVLNEPIGAPQLCGAALVFAGVVLVSTGRPPTLVIAEPPAAPADSRAPGAVDILASSDLDRARHSAKT